MATRPIIKSLNANATSSGILNHIVQNGYLAGAPQVDNTVQSIAQMGEYINGYQPRRNEFVEALMNLVAIQVIIHEEYSNPWSFALQGTMDYGETLEEVFVNPARPENYNANYATIDDYLKDRFGDRTADILAAMHTINFEKKYVTTIKLKQLNKAFRSADGVANLTNEIAASLYTGFEHDNFLMLKYVLDRLVLDGKIVAKKVAGLSSQANIEDTLEVIRKWSNELTFKEAGYTLSREALTRTPIEKQVDILTVDADASVSVKALAYAFHKEEQDFLGKRILKNDWNAYDLARLGELLTPRGAAENVVPFTDAELAILDTIVGYIIDEKFLMQVDQLVELAEDGMAGNNLSWQYVLHHWAYFGASMFKNAIVFTTSDGSITSVTVTPATASMAKGSSMQMTATIVSSGIVDQDVIWSCTEGGVIDSYGRITITADPAGVGEDPVTVTVTATSVADSTKAGTATITVV